MTATEDNNEEVTFKVTDKRKYNPDGSIKEGVVLEPAPPPKPEPPASDTGILSSETPPETADGPIELANEPAPHDTTPHTDGSADEIPGAEDPASFINFLSTLATNAAASLGAVPHPATGQRSVDLETGKYWLDVLSMLGEKTKGNLHPKEAQLFEGLLADLRMQYVTMVRATEEKLKAQAAKKFSGDDILGRG